MGTATLDRGPVFLSLISRLTFCAISKGIPSSWNERLYLLNFLNAVILSILFGELSNALDRFYLDLKRQCYRRLILGLFVWAWVLHFKKVPGLEQNSNRLLLEGFPRSWRERLLGTTKRLSLRFGLNGSALGLYLTTEVFQSHRAALDSLDYL